MSLRPLRCQQCAALLTPREGHSLVRCAFCGSTYLLEGDAARPPPPAARARAFQTAASAARLCVEAWLDQGLVRPGDLARCAVVAEPQPVLVPMYRGRARAHSNWTAAVGQWEAGVDVEALQNEVRQESVGGSTEAAAGDGTAHVESTPGRGRRVKIRRETHLMSGQHDHDYKDVVIAASRGLAEHQVLWLVPAAFDDLVALDFDAPPGGALIEEPVFGPEDAEVRLRECLNERERAACSGMVPGRPIVDLRVNTVLDGIHLECAFLPAYTVEYRYRDRTYRALVDGVSGQVTGVRPMSGPRLILVATALLAVPLAVGWWLWRRRLG